MRLTEMDIDLLSAASKRGAAGITKDELMLELSKSVRGLAYADLRRHVDSLARGGLAEVEETGPDDFTIVITESGREAIRS